MYKDTLVIDKYFQVRKVFSYLRKKNSDYLHQHSNSIAT